MNDPTRDELMRWCAKQEGFYTDNPDLCKVYYDSACGWIYEDFEDRQIGKRLLPNYLDNRDAAVRVVEAACKTPAEQHLFGFYLACELQFVDPLNQYIGDSVSRNTVAATIEFIALFSIATATAEQLIRAAYHATGGK